MDGRRTSTLWLVLLALGGLLTGHLVSYFVAAPDAHERAELLAATGHSEHGLFGTVALAAAFAAVIGMVSQALRSRHRAAPVTSSRVRVAALLWTLQTAGFVALETWERGHGLFDAAELLHEPAFTIGLVAQAVAALTATALVLLVRATVAALLRLLVIPHARVAAPVTAPSRSRRPRRAVARAAWNLRGPPAPAVHTG